MRKAEKIKKICQVCNKKFKVFPYRASTAKFCSYKCYWKNMAGKKGNKAIHWQGGPIKKTCLTCGNNFLTQLKVNKKYCSYKCCDIYKKGLRSFNWKGGKTTSPKGYVFIYKPSHPRSNKNGYVMRSYLVMEKHLKRFLKPKEIVHHKGTKYPMGSYKDKGDDRIENLRLFPNKSKHSQFHAKLRNPKGSLWGANANRKLEQ